MYAIVKVGGQQYKVSEGETIEVNRLNNEKGKSITLDNVLFYAKGTDVRVGQPALKDVKVAAKVINDALGKKTIAFKYRRRKDSKTKTGHRQKLTTLNITKITAS